MKDGLDPVEVGRKIAEIALERDEARAMVVSCHAFLADLADLYLLRYLPPCVRADWERLIDRLSGVPWVLPAGD